MGWVGTLNPISFQPHGVAPSPMHPELGQGGRKGHPTQGPSGDPSHLATPITLSIYNQFKRLPNSRGSPKPPAHLKGARPHTLHPESSAPSGLDLGNYILRFPQHLFLIQRSGGQAGTGGVGSAPDGSGPAFPRDALRRLHILIPSPLRSSHSPC